MVPFPCKVRRYILLSLMICKSATYTAILCCMVVQCSYGQNKQLLFAQDNMPQALLLNPGADHRYGSYYGIPLLSGVSVSGGSSGLSVWDVFQEGGDINARINDALLRLDNKDLFTVNEQIELLSVGWTGKDQETLFSAGIYQETDFILYFPKEWALLAYNGNADFLNRSFEFSELSGTVEVLTAYHFGINKKLSRKLRVGARAKLYMSILNGNTTSNKGFFRTRVTSNGPNFFTHEVVGADVQGRSSGFNDLFNNGPGTALKRAFVSPNLGLGLDVGFTYNITNQWSANGSLIDIGFIAHTTDLRNISFTGDYELNGIELEFPALVQGQATTDYWNEFLLEAEAALPFQDFGSESYTTLRPVKLNVGLNYRFGEDRKGVCNCLNKDKREYTSSLGVHINAIKRPRSILTAATVYYDKSWFSFLNTRISYTVDPFTYTNVGLLVNTKINNFNLYLAADNVLEYANFAKARSASVQLGMQVILPSQ